MENYYALVIVVLLINPINYCQSACNSVNDVTACDRFDDIPAISNKLAVKGLIVNTQDTPLPCDYPILGDFPGLLRLEVRDGHIPFVEHLCFRELPLLSTLLLTSDKIVAFDFYTLNGKRITDLHLGDNHIRVASLDGVEMPKLRLLNLTHNLLSSFTINSVNAPELEKVFLDNNKLVKFKIQSETATEVDLGNNALQSFEADDLKTPRVHILSLNDNNLRSVTAEMVQHLPNLGLIILSNNFLHQVEFPIANNLNYISMRNNKIRSIDSFRFGFSTRSRSLDLSYNRLYELQPNALFLRNMFLFACDSCHIHYVDTEFFSKFMPQVQSVFLRQNYIRSLDLLKSPAELLISHLVLSYNFIESISKDEFLQVPHLKVLMMQFNKIKTIEKGSFDHLTALEEVDLGYNCIHQIPDNLFRDSVKSVILSYNLLTRLPIPSETDHQFWYLNKFSVVGNPLQCSCYNLILDWITTFSLRQYRVLAGNFFSFGNNPVCIVTNANCSADFQVPMTVRALFRDNKFENHIYGQCDE